MKTFSFKPQKKPVSRTTGGAVRRKKAGAVMRSASVAEQGRLCAAQMTAG
ncbi:hypothetical protein M1D55_04135 [Cupriavidus sp. JZ107]